MTSGDGETPIIVHDMQLAHGNSGGPLVDACGRLGGVNSLFFAEASQVGNVALDVSALRKFLAEKQIPFIADDSPCGGAGPTSLPANQPPPTARKDDAEKAPIPAPPTVPVQK
jgi:S1-C subfamily serine protease